MGWSGIPCKSVEVGWMGARCVPATSGPCSGPSRIPCRALIPRSLTVPAVSPLYSPLTQSHAAASSLVIREGDLSAVAKQWHTRSHTGFGANTCPANVLPLVVAPSPSLFAPRLSRPHHPLPPPSAKLMARHCGTRTTRCRNDGSDDDSGGGGGSHHLTPASGCFGVSV